MSLVVSGRKKVDPDSDLWQSVLEVTDQPSRIGHPLDAPLPT
jgi:hypothetical protein